jgi:hypothetical protein
MIRATMDRLVNMQARGLRVCVRACVRAVCALRVRHESLGDTAWRVACEDDAGALVKGLCVYAHEGRARARASFSAPLPASHMHTRTHTPPSPLTSGRSPTASRSAPSAATCCRA